MKYGRPLWVAGLWLAAFLVPELAARWFLPEWAPQQENTRTMIADRDTGWLYKPHAEADTARVSGTFIANSLGLREGELGAKQRPRVVFFGDSFTWGWGVPNGVRYTDRLQQAYPGYQIVNAGINGYSTVQEMLLLKKYQQQMMPDLVVLQVFHNDFIENLETQGVYAKPYLDWKNHFVLKNHPMKSMGDDVPTRILLWVANHTYFYRQLVVAGYVLFNQHKEPAAEPPTDEKILAEAMQVALGSFIGFCQEKNIPLLVVSSDLKPYQLELITRVTDSHGITHYDLTQRVFKDKKNFALGDHAAHWNAYGHQLVADFLGPVMDEKLRLR